MRGSVSSVSVLVLVLAFSGITAILEDKFFKCSTFFLNRKAPVIPGILKESAAQNSNYKIICQRYKNIVRFATLYDTARKIPLFSAYKYTGAQDNSNVETSWMIESQLEPRGSAMHEPFDLQAKTEDYYKNSLSMRPGFLFPVSHAADQDTAMSAFTLTNTIPMNFSEDYITEFENSARKYMNTNCRDPKNNTEVLAYVLYGAVPDNNDTLNGRVNIPFVKWIAICCFDLTVNLWKAQAIKVDHTQHTNVAFEELQKLENDLNVKWGKRNAKVKLFYNNCKSAA